MYSKTFVSWLMRIVRFHMAARSGMEKTKEMVARSGRAKSLNERSIGHADPGAISTYLQLSFMAEIVALEG